jgi:hypothetical protein
MSSHDRDLTRGRDIKLDLFRGLSLFIILIDHTRGNLLARWTPGNFGLSDAAAVFICVSGYTVALAFGKVYRDSGWLLGTARTALRVWQLYIAQLVLIMVVASLPSIALHALDADGYGSTLKLDYLFNDPAEAIWHAVTLTYVPPGLDILPVYVAMMAMIPAVMAIAWVDGRLVPLCSVMLWAAARHFGWNLLADPSDGRGWFFDPFAWQLVFLTGFSLAMGWLPAPPRKLWLQAAAAAMLAFGLLAQLAPAAEHLALLGAVNALYNTPQFKTLVDPLTYLYFVAFAYLAVPLFTRWLAVFRQGPQHLFVVAGQQSLAVFLGTVVLADVGGVVFDVEGTGPAMQVVVNVAGFLALTALAYFVAWYKSAPWRQRRAAIAAPPEPQPARQFSRPARAAAE